MDTRVPYGSELEKLLNIEEMTRGIVSQIDDNQSRVTNLNIRFSQDGSAFVTATIKKSAFLSSKSRD